MTRASFSTLVAVLASASWPLVPAAAQQPLRTALIISNSQYANLPPLERCPSSAALVRDALRGKGFEVVERSDLKRGEFDAAIGALARRAAASPPAFSALYYCGYAIEFNGRSFLLPTSANISREDDVLTQGVISKSLVDSLARVGDSSGFVMLDGFARPGTAATGLARLVEQIAPARYAVIGVSNEGPGQGPTMASQAVRDQVAGSEISLETFVAGLRRQLAKETAVFVPATGPAAFLAGGRPPAPPAPTPPPTPPPTPVAAQPATPVPPPVAPPPAAAPPPRQITMVDEEQMSDQDRRQIQVALATMGYYSGRIDATFGPETRAAIRRFQFEIKAELTGRLTGEQATKLVNSGR